MDIFNELHTELAEQEAAEYQAEQAKLTCMCTGLSGNKFCRKHNDSLANYPQEIGEPTMSENRLTPFGVIEHYLHEENQGWSSHHADRILERLTAEGYAVTRTVGVRDYATEPGHVFSLDTTGNIAGFIFGVAEDETHYRVGAGITRDVARELGTDLLGWVHSGLTSTVEDIYYETVNGAKLYAAAVDSICELVIGDTNVPPISFEMNTDVTVDIGQRLIAFAGVNVNAVMEV